MVASLTGLRSPAIKLPIALPLWPTMSAISEFSLILAACFVAFEHGWSVHNLAVQLGG
jgi:hypothetical protein